MAYHCLFTAERHLHVRHLEHTARLSGSLFVRDTVDIQVGGY